MNQTPYGSASDRAGNDTVILGEATLQTVGPVRTQDLARFQGKITTGDSSSDSDPLISTYSMSSFTGGMGNERLKEGVDDETYWTGTMETRYPGQITNLPRTDTFVFPTAAATARALGDFPASAPQFWAVGGTQLYRFNVTTRAFAAIGTALPATPLEEGVEFNGKLFLPLGSSGIATVTSAGVIDTTAHAAIQAVSLCLYDRNKLAALTAQGQLRIMDSAEVWETPADALKLPSGHVPRKLLVYINQNQEPTIHIVTSRDVWAYDRANTYIFRTGLQFPPHPHQGRASVVFRGESMYVSVGIGIHGYNGNTVVSMGPDGRYGLPAHLRGYITHLQDEYNGMIAVVQGAPVITQGADTFTITPPQYQDDAMVFPETSAVSSLLRWNQQGWHPVWESADASGLPTNSYVSAADGLWYLWWAYAGNMYRQKLPVAFQNPKLGMIVGESRFADRGTLTTGYFDADMFAFDKLASHFELVIDNAFEDGRPLGEVIIRYQIDEDKTWTSLGTATGVGRYVFPFGNFARPDGSTFSGGLAFNRIRFRIESISLSETVTPVIQNMLFKFIKLPLSQLSWTFTIDVGQNDGFMGQGNATLAAYVRGLASSQAFTHFVHRDQHYRVRVAQTQGAEMTGYDERATMTVSVIGVEVPPSVIAAPSA
ncbi:MAG TPA: hypothetical protein VNJ04_19720 [Gemmatimonadaceae bacterium]|nr:hypothetical protein [Gemmatimonadaceae bacterium]